MIIGIFAGQSVIWIGVLVLTLTPFIRVLMAGICFLSQKDMFYFLIALYVMLVLVISYVLSA